MDPASAFGARKALYFRREAGNNNDLFVARMQTRKFDCKPAIDERCSHRCHHQWEDYERCAKRIEAKGEGECSGWYMDYLTCVDKCAAQVLFKTLS